MCVPTKCAPTNQGNTNQGPQFVDVTQFVGAHIGAPLRFFWEQLKNHPVYNQCITWGHIWG